MAIDLHPITGDLRKRTVSYEPRPCRACGALITDATQHNQVYHNNPDCQAIRLVHIAHRRRELQREYRKNHQFRHETEALAEKRRTQVKVRVKCLGPEPTTHFFMSNDPKTQRICPQCCNVIAGRSGGMDDVYGDPF